MSSAPAPSSRQRKLQRRRERREAERQVTVRQSRRNRWVRLGITMLITTAVYALIILVWDPFGLMRGGTPG